MVIYVLLFTQNLLWEFTLGKYKSYHLEFRNLKMASDSKSYVGYYWLRIYICTQTVWEYQWPWACAFIFSLYLFFLSFPFLSFIQSRIPSPIHHSFIVSESYSVFGCLPFILSFIHSLFVFFSSFPFNLFILYLYYWTRWKSASFCF